MIASLLAIGLLHRFQGSGYNAIGYAPLMGHTAPTGTQIPSGGMKSGVTATLTDMDTYQLAIPPNTAQTFGNPYVTINAVFSTGITVVGSPTVNYVSSTGETSKIWTLQAKEVADNSTVVVPATFTYTDNGGPPVKDENSPVTTYSSIDIVGNTTEPGGGPDGLR